jgi:Na+-transporting NADH:ubiquinone oxidoreductase subunit NqrD
MKGFDVIKGFAKELMEVLVLFVGLGVLAGVIFGEANISFFAGITDNLIGLLNQFGSNGLIGFIALLLVISVFKRGSAA